jgi:hypothetical protein
MIAECFAMNLDIGLEVLKEIKLPMIYLKSSFFVRELHPCDELVSLPDKRRLSLVRLYC